MKKKLTRLIVSLMLVIGLFGPGGPPPARAEDCGPPPLPPCQGQGAGENPASSSPTATSGATSSPAASTTTNSSSSCGPPPLPPCQGQGAGETSTPTTSPTTAQPTQATSSSTTSPPTSDLIIANLFVTDVFFTEGQVQLTLTFQTNQESRAEVTLTDEIKTSDLLRNVTTDTYSLAHEAAFHGLPLTGRFGVTITVTTKDGVSQTRADTMLILADGRATLLESTGGTTGSREPASNSGSLSVADQALAVFLGQRVTQSITVADVSLWFFLVLLGLAAILEGFFFAKRRRLWGVIYDARTKMPVEMAVVRLFDQEHHKLLETRVTPKSGRYSFLAEPGEYYLEVTKEGYHFPSRIVDGSIDNEYTNLYLGRTIKLGAGQSLIAPDVPIDSEAGEVQKPGFFRRVMIPVLDIIRLPLLVIVFLMALAYQFLFIKPLESLAKTPSDLLLFGSLGIVIILMTLEFLFVRRGRK